MHRAIPQLWCRVGASLVCLLALSFIEEPRAQAKHTLSGVVNLNEAPVRQLVMLPGIGAEKAARIVSYRAKRKFKRTVELARVRGIGLRTVRKLKTFLSVEGPSTLQRGHRDPSHRRDRKEE